MKKTLLLGFALATCFGSGYAAEPMTLKGASVQQISADGHYAVSEVYGTVIIYDLKTGDIANIFEPDEDYIYSYSLGLGNCVTADGSIILGSTKESSNACYLQNGEWHDLNVPTSDDGEELINLSNGITPDGSRICGSIGLVQMTLEDALMMIPGYWDRNADGTYGEYKLLPYPGTDLFGKTPQYITAIAISSDGKTIVGQVRDCRGMYHYPIVYTEDAQGKWSYSLPTKDLFNPNGIELAPDPGESPAWPYYANYMTEAEITEYEAAEEAYYAGELDEYPDFKDFMGEESLAKYNAAKDEYDEWEAKYDAYTDSYMEISETSPNFLFNNVYISTDGKKVVGTLTREEESDTPSWGWGPSSITINTPCSVEIATGKLTAVDTEISCMVSGVADNDIILASNEVGSIPMTGYVIKDGEMQTIDAYIASKSATYGEWIKTNMTHEAIIGWDDDYNEIIEEVVYTGVPVATPDMSFIAIWNDCGWDYDTEYFAETTVFDMTATGGISSIIVSDSNLSVDENGNLNVPDGFVSVQIYNVNGACVKSVETVGTVDMNLASGVYIAKGTRNDGSVSIVKIAK